METCYVCRDCAACIYSKWQKPCRKRVYPLSTASCCFQRMIEFELWFITINTVMLKKQKVKHTQYFENIVHIGTNREWALRMCPVWHSSLTVAQTKTLESLQQRAIKIIFPAVKDYMSLIFANVDTLESRREQLTERFFRQSVLRKSSCLHYLLPDKRDSVITDRLCHPKTFKPLLMKTEKFRKSFVPYCLKHYD